MWARLAGYRPKRLGLFVFFAGALMTLGFAPFNLWPVGVVGLAVFYALLVRAESWRQALGLCFIWGIGWHLSALYWLPRAFYLDAGRDIWAAVFGGIPGMFAVAAWSVLGVMAAGLAGYGGVVWARRRALESTKWAAGLLLGAWVAMEVVKSLHPMGFPWLLVGAMAGNWPVLGQAASVGGVYLLSALFWVVAILLAEGWQQRRLWVLAGCVLAVWGGWGMMRLAGANEMPREDALRLRLVQPNIQDPLKWNPVVRWHYLEETAQLMKAPGWQLADVFVLPENALPFDVAREPEANTLLRAGLSPHQLVVGGTIGRDEVVVAGVPQIRFTNRFAVLGDAGQQDKSDKVLLVPFGEYVPWRKLIALLPLPAQLHAFIDGRVDYTPGRRPELLDIEGAQALPLVCYEGIFAPYVARHAAGADLLLNLTSDMWFTGTIALSQHAALARLRAIENGLPLVRVATTGITVVYDAYGREVVRLPINVALVQDVVLPPALPATPWRKLF